MAAPLGCATASDGEGMGGRIIWVILLAVQSDDGAKSRIRSEHVLNIDWCDVSMF